MRIKQNFPSNPINDQIYIDGNGVEWKYKSGLKRWFENRFHKDSPIVSPSDDGLIYPDIYSKLELLELHHKNFNFSTFKIYPGLDSYYYYLYSPSGLIDIRHNDDIININVNEQKLYAHYYRIMCAGDRGFIGVRGPIGDTGMPAPDEVDYLPERSNTKITGEIYNPIPIGTYILNNEITPISLRIFGLIGNQTEFNLFNQIDYLSRIMADHLLNENEKIVFNRLVDFIAESEITNGTEPGVSLTPIIADQINRNVSALLEIDINPVNSAFTIVNNGLNIPISAINVEFNRQIGLLKFEISGNWPKTVVARSRQRGPRGDRGDTPLNYISEFVCEFPDSNVRPDEALNHIRLDCENDAFYVTYTRLESQDAFSNVTTDPLATLTVSSEPSKGRFVAVERIIDPNKRIILYDNALGEIKTNEPTFINWVPPDGCQTKRSFSNYEFDWVPETDKGTCYTDAKWYGPEGVRESMYPHEIILPKEPETENCCQDEFFIFPESGNC